LDAGANVNTRNQDGETALLVVLYSKDTCKEKKLDIVCLILTVKCNINVEVSALFYVCDKYPYCTLKKLIASGADLTEQNHEGMTALHVVVRTAASTGPIHHGVDVNTE